jgi:arsenite methyltransferase
MQDEISIKNEVRQRYGAVAKAGAAAAGCCAPSCCGGPSPVDAAMGMNESYAGQAGYAAEADLALGCGVPTQYAALQLGETVLDLGSGAGNDAFVAAAEVGLQGQVIGVDMTPEMITTARQHAQRLGQNNVTFRLGEIEHLPVDTGSIDVIISNCVLNLVPHKEKAFAEMARVLKPGGRFSVSDIVFEGKMPEALRQVAELYVGCVSGALQKHEYLDGLAAAGFQNSRIAESKEWPLAPEIVQPFLPAGADAKTLLATFKVIKVTVTGKLPSA